MTGILARLVPAFALAFASDWLTKRWAEQKLSPSAPVPLIGQEVRLTLGYNTGVAFGMFTKGGAWLAVLASLLIVGALLWLVWAVCIKEAHPALAWPVGLLLGGGSANLLDRLGDGRVTDFIDVGVGAARWPTFNLADACIVVAVAAFLLTGTEKSTTA